MTVVLHYSDFRLKTSILTSEYPTISVKKNLEVEYGNIYTFELRVISTHHTIQMSVHLIEGNETEMQFILKAKNCLKLSQSKSLEVYIEIREKFSLTFRHHICM